MGSADSNFLLLFIIMYFIPPTSLGHPLTKVMLPCDLRIRAVERRSGASHRAALSVHDRVKDTFYLVVMHGYSKAVYTPRSL